MVWPAQQDQVRERGRPPIGPMHDVMRIAPSVGTVAAREPAMPVPDRHGPAQSSGHHGGPPADVERLGPSPGDDPAHQGVAGPPPGGLGRDRADLVELTAGARPAFQRLQVHGHRDIRALPGHLGPIRPVQPVTADVPKASARRCAEVRMSGASPERISASWTHRSAVMRVSPVSGSRSPSTRTMPSRVGDTCIAEDRRATRRSPLPGGDQQPAASTRRRGGAHGPKASTRTWPAAAEKAIRNRRASHADIDRYPSRRYGPSGRSRPACGPARPEGGRPSVPARRSPLRARRRLRSAGPRPGARRAQNGGCSPHRCYRTRVRFAVIQVTPRPDSPVRARRNFSETARRQTGSFALGRTMEAAVVPWR